MCCRAGRGHKPRPPSIGQAAARGRHPSPPPPAPPQHRGNAPRTPIHERPSLRDQSRKAAPVCASFSSSVAPFALENATFTLEYAAFPFDNECSAASTPPAWHWLAALGAEVAGAD